MLTPVPVSALPMEAVVAMD
ncbi:hypothetical protein BIW11_13397 [Tropilaelaps mercedesae]|uniref:Uncharacterized protein n=1 Tax=Tropilaelaps mercedesae TaxID=418985 RepID=A0A1V9X1W4_9ACAR|nr:hypothetical protein BIW11_13397 [Tropilaelaps mercedesae]